MAKLIDQETGTVLEFDVIKDEDISESANVTDKKVEEGSDISDHMKDNPMTVRMPGVMINRATSPQSIHTLRGFKEGKKLLTYSGRNIIKNLVLQDFKRNHNSDNADGYGFNLSFKQIRITRGKRVSLEVANAAGKSDPKMNNRVKSVTNKGQQQLKVR